MGRSRTDLVRRRAASTHASAAQCRAHARVHPARARPRECTRAPSPRSAARKHACTQPAQCCMPCALPASTPASSPRAWCHKAHCAVLRCACEACLPIEHCYGGGCKGPPTCLTARALSVSEEHDRGLRRRSSSKRTKGPRLVVLPLRWLRPFFLTEMRVASVESRKETMVYRHAACQVYGMLHDTCAV
jgi:hypothetical protein